MKDLRRHQSPSCWAAGLCRGAALLGAALLCLLAWAGKPVSAGSWSTPGAATRPAGAPRVAPPRVEGPETYFIEWAITGTGQWRSTAGSARTVATRQVAVRGSAVIFRPAGAGDLRTLPFALTVTDDYSATTRGTCPQPGRHWQEFRRRIVADPARYMGGPDPFWRDPRDFRPQQRDDGSWFIDDPFDLEFWIAGQGIFREFTYHDETRDDDCNSSSSSAYDTESSDYVDILDGLTYVPSAPLEGDANGVIFARADQYVVPTGGGQMAVTFDVTLRRVCAGVAALAQTGTAVTPETIAQLCGSCANHPGPLDIDHPLVTQLDLHLSADESRITPDGKTTLTISATCWGVPVKNAELEVAVKPEEASGWHKHGGDAERPRGILNQFEISAERPAILVMTGDDGTVQVSFEPGKDLRDHVRGVAGTYLIKVRPTAARFKYRQAEAMLQVDYELQPLDDNPVLYDVYADDPNHGEAHWGTPATLNGIGQFATDFWIAQAQHNDDLAFYGLPKWPLVKPEILAISIPRGGLFDFGVGGWWRPPFNTHLSGADVLVEPGLTGLTFPGVTTPQARAWLEREFIRIGSHYGSWYSDGGSPWNLGGGASVQQSAAPAPGRQAAAQPDLAVVVLLPASDRRFTVFPGQVVTYTVGLENLNRTTPAYDTVLTATLPPGLAFVTAAPPPLAGAGGQVVWQPGVVTATAVPQVYSIAAQVGAGVVPGTLFTVTAQAQSRDGDAAPGDNQAAAFGLTVQPAGADLSIFTDLAATALTVDRPVTFTLGIANRGNQMAASAVLSLTLPPSTTVRSASPAPASDGTHLVWHAGDLAVDAQAAATVTVDLEPELILMASSDPDAGTGRYLTFTLHAGTATADIDTLNDETRIVQRVTFAGHDAQVALGFEGSPYAGTVAAGQEITYALHYGNFGNQVAPTAVVTLSLWSGLSVLKVVPAPAQVMTDAVFGGGVLVWPVGDLPAGASDVITVRTQADAVSPEGSLILATVQAAVSDILPANNVALVRERTAAARFVYLPSIERR